MITVSFDFMESVAASVTRATDSVPKTRVRARSKSAPGPSVSAAFRDAIVGFSPRKSKSEATVCTADQAKALKGPSSVMTAVRRPASSEGLA